MKTVINMKFLINSDISINKLHKNDTIHFIQVSTYEHVHDSEIIILEL